MTAPIPFSGPSILGGAIWPDDATLAARPGPGAEPHNPELDPDTGMVRWQPAGAAGHYEPVTTGDTDDPQPFYTFDANDCPEFMMLWMTET